MRLSNAGLTSTNLQQMFALMLIGECPFYNFLHSGEVVVVVVISVLIISVSYTGVGTVRRHQLGCSVK